MLIQNENYEEALGHLLHLKRATDMNSDTETYLKICQLIVSCAGFQGNESLIVDNLEDVYLIFSAISSDADRIFEIEKQLIQFYIFDLKTEYQKPSF